MIILDTDHLTVVLDGRDSRHDELVSRLDAANQTVSTTVVNLEEGLRGWLAFVNKYSAKIPAQVSAYHRLIRLVKTVGQWDLLPFEKQAADYFMNQRHSGVRIGTMDLKIGAIAVANDGLLLTTNLRDFRLVPGLTCEDWLN